LSDYLYLYSIVFNWHRHILKLLFYSTGTQSIVSAVKGGSAVTR